PPGLTAGSRVWPRAAKKRRRLLGQSKCISLFSIPKTKPLEYRSHVTPRLGTHPPLLIRHRRPNSASSLGLGRRFFILSFLPASLTDYSLVGRPRHGPCLPRPRAADFHPD